MPTKIAIIVEKGTVTDVLSPKPPPDLKVEIIDLDQTDDERLLSYDLKRTRIMRSDWIQIGQTYVGKGEQ